MSASFAAICAHQQALRMAVATSPIVTRDLDTLLANWETTRRSPDVDGVILAWLARQGRSRRLSS
jgi:ABC-type tungstate transport system permease subunit